MPQIVASARSPYMSVINDNAMTIQAVPDRPARTANSQIPAGVCTAANSRRAMPCARSTAPRTFLRGEPVGQPPSRHRANGSEHCHHRLNDPYIRKVDAHRFNCECRKH